MQRLLTQSNPKSATACLHACMHAWWEQTQAWGRHPLPARMHACSPPLACGASGWPSRSTSCMPLTQPSWLLCVQYSSVLLPSASDEAVAVTAAGGGGGGGGEGAGGGGGGGGGEEAVRAETGRRPGWPKGDDPALPPPLAALCAAAWLLGALLLAAGGGGGGAGGGAHATQCTHARSGASTSSRQSPKALAAGAEPAPSTAADAYMHACMQRGECDFITQCV